MANKRKLDAAVDRATEIIVSRMEEMTPEDARSFQQDLRALTLKPSRSADRQKASVADFERN